MKGPSGVPTLHFNIDTRPHSGAFSPAVRNTDHLTDFDSLSLNLSLDRENGEVRILDQRFAVVDISEFCKWWDALVGRKVAGVQMKSLEYHLGQADARALMKKMPNATTEENTAHLEEADRISGVGVSKVTRLSDELFHIEIQNPVVAATEGAAAFFASGWWCGAMDTVLKKRFDVSDIRHNEERRLLKFNLVARPIQEESQDHV